jgi:5'-nucleotidase
MRWLLSNDDGVQSPGLIVLAETLSEIADVSVVAPDRDYSGASHSLTLNRPLLPTRLKNGFIRVDGTPSDCVHLGISVLFDGTFDRVVSGINTHANLGDDVLYSGTVAAAMEGRFLPQPCIAVSLVNAGAGHFETAAQVIKQLLMNERPLQIQSRSVLNINVPDVPFNELKGIQITRLGHRQQCGLPQPVEDPRGQKRYWIAAAGDGDDCGEGTDFYAVEQGYVSITPIHADMSRYDAFDAVKQWAEVL